MLIWWLFKPDNKDNIRGNTVLYKADARLQCISSFLIKTVSYNTQLIGFGEAALTQHTKQVRQRFNQISKDAFSQAGSLLITVETQSTSVTRGSSRQRPDDFIYTPLLSCFFLHQQHLLAVLSAGKTKQPRDIPAISIQREEGVGGLPVMTWPFPLSLPLSAFVRRFSGHFMVFLVNNIDHTVLCSQGSRAQNRLIYFCEVSNSSLMLLYWWCYL